MNKRLGHRAQLPLGDHVRPPVIAEGTLVVLHVEEDTRRQSHYDFSLLPVSETMQRELAQHFASWVGPAGTWRALATSAEGWRVLSVLAAWLSQQPAAPTSLADLTVSHWSAWRLSRSPSTTGVMEIRKSSQFLRDHRLIAPAVQEAMLQRSRKQKPKETAYPSAEFDTIKKTAQRTFRSALHRIRENKALLDSYRAGQLRTGSDAWQVGRTVDYIARHGDAPTYASPSTDGSERVRQSVGLPRGMGTGTTWQRLFLTGEEAASLGILLIATYGWNATPTSELRVPDSIPNPGVGGQTIYRVSLVKRRRGKANSHETRNLTDWGADSPGRLIAQAIEATAPARECLAAGGEDTDRLIVWHRNKFLHPEKPASEVFCAGVSASGYRNLGRIWEVRHGLGAVNLRRLRKTVVLERREPIQHNQDTHDQVYVLPDPQTIERAIPIIDEGVTSALAAAMTTFAAQTSRHDQPPGGDTVTATCTDYESSPFTPAGTSCRASFLLCTACPNAVITPRHLPRLAYLLLALDDLRGVVPRDDWHRDWRAHYARLMDLRQRHDFTDQEWAQALAEVTSDDRNAIDMLLGRKLEPR
jgi:hypothetical protein